MKKQHRIGDVVWVVNDHDIKETRVEKVTESLVSDGKMKVVYNEGRNDSSYNDGSFTTAFTTLKEAKNHVIELLKADYEKRLNNILVTRIEKSDD